MLIRAQKAGLLEKIQNFGAQMATLISLWRDMSGVDPAGLRRLFEDKKLLARMPQTARPSAQSPSTVYAARLRCEARNLVNRSSIRPEC